VRIWDVSTGVEVQTLTGHTNSVSCIAFSPSGHQLASVSWDRTVRVWDISAGATVHRPTTHTTNFHRFAFSPSGMQFAAASLDGTVWIWDSSTGDPIGSPLSHSGEIMSMYYHERTGALLLVVNPWVRDLTVWNMSVTPPSLFSTRDPPACPTPSPSRFVVDRWSKRTFIPTASISFYLPSFFSFPTFPSNQYSSHEGRIAYNGLDGTVILIDCSHLLPNSSAI
jgi:WD40 repeat protein